MRRLRLLAAALVALAVVATPTAALAADGPEIRYATSEFEGNVGVLLVSVASAGGVDSVHADVKNNAGEQIDSSDDFWLYSGTHEDGVWATREPFQLGQMGYYPVDVTVTDNNGVTTQRANAGQLTYVVMTFLDSLRTRPERATYERREVTVSGVLKGTWPGSGEIRRIPDASLEIFGSTSWNSAETAADGSFSSSVPISTDGELVSVNFPHDPDLPFFASTFKDAGMVPIQPRVTRVTSTVTARRIDVGEQITVSGTASWRTPAGWEPVPAGRVAVESCDANDYCTDVYGVPDVDGQGGYSVSFTPRESTILSVRYLPPALPDGGTDPYVAMSRRTTEIYVLQEAEIFEFTASRDEAGKVVLDGQVRFPGNLTPGVIPVEFLFSETGSGGWVVIGDDPGAEWSGAGYRFTASLSEPRSGYWRARYPGDPRGFQSAVSPKIYVP